MQEDDVLVYWFCGMKFISHGNNTNFLCFAWCLLFKHVENMFYLVGMYLFLFKINLKF